MLIIVKSQSSIRIRIRGRAVRSNHKFMINLCYLRQW